MDTAKVVPVLLHALDDSPIWRWDSPPSLWPLMGEDPVVVLPALMFQSLDQINAVSEAWAQQMPGDAVKPEALCLVTDGWLPPVDEGGMPQTGVLVEVRDAVLITKTGDLSMFRHFRGGSITELEVDPTAPAVPSVEAMRSVAASAWRD